MWKARKYFQKFTKFSFALRCFWQNQFYLPIFFKESLSIECWRRKCCHPLGCPWKFLRTPDFPLSGQWFVYAVSYPQSGGCYIPCKVVCLCSRAWDIKCQKAENMSAWLVFTWLIISTTSSSQKHVKIVITTKVLLTRLFRWGKKDVERLIGNQVRCYRFN